MHNIKEIRKNFDNFKNKLKNRNTDTDLDSIIGLDEENRKLIKEKEWYQRNPFKEEHKIEDVTSFESAASPKSKVLH